MRSKTLVRFQNGMRTGMIELDDIRSTTAFLPHSPSTETIHSKAPAPPSGYTPEEYEIRMHVRFSKHPKKQMQIESQLRCHRFSMDDIQRICKDLVQEAGAV